MEEHVTDTADPPAMVAHGPQPLAAGPTAIEGLIADRQSFWISYTRLLTSCAAIVVVLLVILAATIA